jgi:Cu2+-containing amine oxidase
MVFGMSYDYDGIERRLRARSDLVGKLVPDLAEWFDEYLDVGEYGLAVEIVAERLAPDMPRDLTTELAAGLLAEAERMDLPDETRKPLESFARGDAPGGT